MDQLTRDLQVVFGFSKANAATAVDLYRSGLLGGHELPDDLYFLETHPFKGNCLTNKDLPPVRNDGMILRLERLNWLLTEAGGKAV